MSSTAAAIAAGLAQAAVESGGNKLPAFPSPSQLGASLISPKASVSSVLPNPAPVAPDNGDAGVLEPEPGRFNFVTIDPVAVFYLIRDPCVKIVRERCQLKGYEVYLVEQWACSRNHPTFTIATFTGDSSHRIFVGVLSISENEAEWGFSLSEYFMFLRLYGRQKETPLGLLIVTNLSNLPSDLTVIAVPDGDVEKHREGFIINEDLKRMGCGGRSALTLAPPTDASIGRFHQLFRVSDRIPFNEAVMELVKLVQLALVMFQKLAKHFADGLLCDETLKAVKKWWEEYGLDFYNMEPSDGAFGPSTVAALVGMMIGARNRLSAWGAPVPKDAFDLPQLKEAIGYFQKQNKLHRTRRFDPDTIEKLRRLTAKINTIDKYGMVSKAIKSTVAEMSGLTSGGKNQKVDMETTDIEKFIEHLSGDRAKSLWFGTSKQRKVAGMGAAYSIADGSVRRNSLPTATAISRITGGMNTKLALNTSSYNPSRGDDAAAGDGLNTSITTYPLSAPVSTQGHQQIFPTSDNKDHLRKAMFKSMTGHVRDAKSGLGKIKDVATGVASEISNQMARRHQRMRTLDYIEGRSTDVCQGVGLQVGENNANANNAVLPSPEAEALRPTSSSLPNIPTSSEVDANQIVIGLQDGYSSLLTASPTVSLPSYQFPGNFDTGLVVPTNYRREGVSPKTERPDVDALFKEMLRKKITASEGEQSPSSSLQGPGQSTLGASMSSSAVANGDAYEERLFSDDMKWRDGPASNLLTRVQSFSRYVEKANIKRNEEYWPTRMSFSEVEEAVLDWRRIGNGDRDEKGEIGESLRNLRHGVEEVEESVGQWTNVGIIHVENLYVSLDQTLNDISATYRNDLATYHSLFEVSNETVPRESSLLSTTIKEVDLLSAKLQYELDALSAKVDEVEEGVANFGKQVEEIEERVEEIENGKGDGKILGMRFVWLVWGWIPWPLGGGKWYNTGDSGEGVNQKKHP